jgi:hypothetical protein
VAEIKALQVELQQAQAELELLAAQLDTATQELVLQSNERNKAQVRVARREEACKTYMGLFPLDLPEYLYSKRQVEVYRFIEVALAEGDADDLPGV